MNTAGVDGFDFVGALVADFVGALVEDFVGDALLGDFVGDNPVGIGSKRGNVRRSKRGAI